MAGTDDSTPRWSGQPVIRIVNRYERYHRHLAAWVDRNVPTLLVMGPPGTGKSCGYRSALGNRPYYVFGGRQSPLQVYMAIHDDPDRPVVLDDIAALLRDDNFRDLLKGLCDTGERTIRWGTTTGKLQGRANAVVCTCPVLIVINGMPKRDPDLEAILDRCDAIRFEPTKVEIIARMRALWPEDQALIDLLAELPVMPSLRTLDKARRWARSPHLDLMEELLAECGVPEPVVRLVEIMETVPADEWCARYMAVTDLTDRTYRRHRPLAERLLATRKSGEGRPIVRISGAPSGAWTTPTDTPIAGGDSTAEPSDGDAPDRAA
jgi:hypothetical protein